MSAHLNKVGKTKIGYSGFNLSHRKLFDCWSGELIPVQADLMLPGDIVDLSQEVVVRTTPLMSPALHEINGTIHRFFVPIRLVDPNFEQALTGGEDGTEPLSFSTFHPPLPAGGPGTLFDYIYGCVVQGGGSIPNPVVKWPLSAYKLIWNEYFRDQHLQEEIDIQDVLTNVRPMFRAWKKDYFTSARPSPQLGPSMALPLVGTTTAEFRDNGMWTDWNNVPPANAGILLEPGPNEARIPVQITGNAAGSPVAKLYRALNDNVVSLENASTFDVNDLRAVFAYQKWQERNMRAGVRYTEFLQARFGVSPRDDRLQRPEFLGRSTFPIIISEVLQTSQTTQGTGGSPQGRLAGHGISANVSRMRRYKCQEFGILMSIFSILPKPSYHQGIDRQWLIKTRYDIPFPEFAHLGEREIRNIEIYASANGTQNDGIFGYRGIFDEHRSKHDTIHNNMRGKLFYWHLSRTFSALPQLNSDFVTHNGTQLTNNNIFAVTDEPPYIVHVGNIFKALRRLPKVAEPGLIDHF